MLFWNLKAEALAVLWGGGGRGEGNEPFFWIGSCDFFLWFFFTNFYDINTRNGEYVYIGWENVQYAVDTCIILMYNML